MKHTILIITATLVLALHAPAQGSSPTPEPTPVATPTPPPTPPEAPVPPPPPMAPPAVVSAPAQRSSFWWLSPEATNPAIAPGADPSTSVLRSSIEPVVVKQGRDYVIVFRW